MKGGGLKALIHENRLQGIAMTSTFITFNIVSYEILMEHSIILLWTLQQMYEKSRKNMSRKQIAC